MAKTQPLGLIPFVSPRTTYDTTGTAVSFRRSSSPNPLKSSHVTFMVYTGTALVSLNGDINGPFIELDAGGAFDFPIATNALFVKGSGGDTEVAVVAGIDPLLERA